MCATCGCADGARIRHQHEDGTWHYHDDGTRHDHDDGAWHEHGAAGPGQPHEHAGGQTVTLEEKVLARNDALARQNRDWLRARGILALNLMSSPGERVVAGQHPLSSVTVCPPACSCPGASCAAPCSCQVPSSCWCP